MRRLVEARTTADLSQTEVATAIGRTQGTISDWETGKTEPSWSDIERLEQLYGTSLRLASAAA